MAATGFIIFMLIFANLLVSYKGFNDRFFFDKYKFEVDKVLVYKDYKRLITGGFLHIGWMHLIFNMFSIYVFSDVVSSVLGPAGLLITYFSGLVGGHLFTLLVQKSHGDYSAVGASGAVCSIIFAAIVLAPGFGIGFIFYIPGWLYGILFVAYSIYGVRSKKDNVGHEAHIGGALLGMLVALCMHPSAFAANYLTILLISIPLLVFTYLVITRPHMLLVDNLFFRKHNDHYSADHKYNANRQNKQETIDRLLDKIHRKGINSLSKKEKDLLDKYSQSIR